MTRYRWYVGKVDKDGQDVPVVDQDTAIRLVDRYMSGCTVYHAVGYWQNQRELSLVIEAIHPDNPESDWAASIAWDLRRICRQNAVLWTLETVNGGLVEE